MNLDIQSLLSDFASEATELIGKAESEIIELEKEHNSERINAVFRYIHTIKGNSGMFELTQISKLAHALESLLGKYREKNIAISKETIDVMLSSVDKLHYMLDHLQEEATENIDDLCNALKNLTDKLEEVVNPLETKILENKTILNFDSAFEKEKMESFLNKCTSENLNGAIVAINLLNQKSILSIDELNIFFHSNANFIYDKILAEKELFSLENYKDTPTNLIYYLLIHSVTTITVAIKTLDIEILDLKILHVAKNESPEILIEQDEIAKTNIQENIEPTNTKSLIPAEKTLEHVPESYLKVKSKLLDDLINLVGETIITRNQLSQVSAFLNDPEGNAVLSRMSQLITQLHEKIMHTRLQELNTINQRVNRVVRDTSRNLGKQVEVVFEGGDVELDKTMLDTLLDSIIHMVRNSIDHGIETPEERIASGKNPTGLIKLSASLQIGNIRIIISDDGKGLNHEKIKNVALNKGLISPNANLSQEEIEDLLFLPGFSTANIVTETSGRGVGMDVVRTSFKKLGGSVHMRSVSGKGTSITATIPQTVTVISCLLISVDNIRYAIFQKNVSELITFEKEMFAIVNGTRMYRFRNMMIPLIHLGKLLYPEKEYKDETEYIVIVKSENYFFGILFEQMLGTEEIVVKPLGEYFQELRIFAGATIMGDGEAVLILDISGVAEFEKIDGHFNADVSEYNSILNKVKREQGFILFDITGNRFATSLESVICIEKLSDYKIENLSGLEVIQYKEAIIPIVTLDEIYNLKGNAISNNAFLIIINIENKNIAVVINEIIDIVYEIQMIEDGRFEGESVLGHSIINNFTTIIIDIKDLLGRVYKHKFQWIGKHLEQLEKLRDLSKDPVLVES